MNADPDATEKALTDAIAQALDQALPGMVTRWVCVTEVIEEDGQRALWSVGPDDAQPWDRLGLMGFAMQLEQAGAVAHTLGEHGHE